MDTEKLTLWGIHSKKESLFTDDKNPVIAIGWDDMGDLSQIGCDRNSFKAKYKTVYPDAKDGNVNNGVGQLYRFACEMKIGDYVVFPCREERQIYIGEITGNYYFEGTERDFPNRRTVKWRKKLPRTAFSQGALYEIGSAMSLFTIKNYAEEFLSALDKSYKPAIVSTDDEEADIKMTAASIMDGTKDFIIKELSKNFKGYDLELFVADVLNAMGYKTTISPHGGDSGIDIIAYRDELPPRVLVQVKSGDSDIKETTLQSLKGAMDDGDYGLFITLADYTKNAKSYLKNQHRIKALNGSEFVDLTLKYYESLSKQFKDVIPLSKVYIPT